MNHIHQSVSWWCFVPNPMRPEAFLRAAAETGYEAIDLVPPEYWSLVWDHGLKIAAVDGHASIGNGLNRRENGDRIVGELESNIARAAQSGIPNLICFSGNRENRGDEEGAEITAENLRRVARLAEDAGVTLVLELLNSKVDHPGYQCDHTSWGIKVCQMVDSPRVKLLYDIYHMQVMEGDVIRTISKNHAYFGHYHTAGNPGRHEIDDSQELNYPAIMKAILDTGYVGYVGQEFIPTGDPLAALRSSFRICNVG